MTFPPFWIDDVNTITWQQHAVGHGGFHTGRMVDEDGTRFTWIFDCGARRHKAFDDEYLRPWLRRQRDPIDWLFVSHFDLDHVSGLDTLMSRAVVRQVMIPYVGDEELVYVFLEEIARDNLERTLVELVADPASFFLSRGAQRVVFLNGGEPRGPGGEAPGGPEDADGSSGARDRGWKEYIDKAIITAAAPAWAATTIGRGPVGVIDGGSCAVNISRGRLGLRLKPYRAPITAAAHSSLLADIQALLGAGHSPSTGRPGLRALAYAIAQHARTSAGKAALRALHKKHVGSSNRASLSLLSEPFGYDPSNCYWHVDTSTRYTSFGRGGAWLSTGDAELLASADLADWQICYASELSHVRVLSLPHHGSDRNSDDQLQALCPDAVLTAQVKSTSKKHPGSDVTLAAGDRLACVTEDASSRVMMWFRGR
jgi:Metallo-beta-lactamase superfamily